MYECYIVLYVFTQLEHLRMKIFLEHSVKVGCQVIYKLKGLFTNSCSFGCMQRRYRRVKPDRSFICRKIVFTKAFLCAHFYFTLTFMVRDFARFAFSNNLNILITKRKTQKFKYFYKCNFPMNLPLRLLVGWSVWFVGLVCLSVIFSNRARSYTSMILSEHLLCQLLRAKRPLHIILSIRQL